MMPMDRDETVVERGGELGRISARPTVSPAGSDPRGLVPLDLDSPRDGFLYVPTSYDPGRPAPLALMLHGAGGNGRNSLGALLPHAEKAGLILVSPDSRLQTWDLLHGGYGPDITFIDRSLTQTFERYAVDPTRVAVEGFSDGASYAISIGLTNGDLFTHVMAFSPGFASPARLVGSPRCLVSHGIHDRTLPIDVCSRKIVPRLRRAGYDVLYREFDGPHTVPPHIATEAVGWFTDGPG